MQLQVTQLLIILRAIKFIPNSVILYVICVTWLHFRWDQMKIFSEPYMLVQYVGGSVAELSHFSLAPAPDIIFLALAPGKKYRLLLHL